MRVLLAFVLGMLVAAGLAVVVFKRQAAAPQQAFQANPAPAAGPAAPALETPPAAATAEPVKPAPSRSAKAGRRESTAQRETGHAAPAPSIPAPSTPAPGGASPAAAAVTSPTAQPAEPAPAVARQEQPAPPPPEPKTVTIAAGTLLSVRLMESLSSDRAQAGDTFSATLDQPLVVDGFVIAERGARLLGKVTSVEKAGRVKGVAQLTLELTELTTADRQKIPIHTDAFVREGPKSVGSDAAKVGVAAGIGAAIGAIAGGGRGAAIGAGVGGAAGTGGVLATRGKAAVLPVETRLSFRLSAPVTVTEKLK